MLKMKNYIGVKAIKASEPITKEEYCKYRGWEVPADEDADTLVRLVEYPVDPDSKPNHPGHKGYISMSPVHVFDKAYSKEKTVTILRQTSVSEPHKGRVVEEYTELDIKITSLEGFVVGEHFQKLREDEQEDLKQQLLIMKAYRTVLTKRINKF